MLANLFPDELLGQSLYAPCVGGIVRKDAYVMLVYVELLE